MGQLAPRLFRNHPINRKDFGVVWSNSLKTGEAVVADNAKIQIDVELVKKRG